ncbi:MAG: adenine phosphoribosyltransferase [Clostridia bacterium]
MKIIRNVLKNELNIRTEKNYPMEGIEFIDITPLILQKETLREITEMFVKHLKEKEIDYIVAPEARGFLFGTAVANELNVGCIPVRKKGKLPPTTVEKQFEYEKEYGKDILELPKLVNQDYENKKFYIIDDIYATGNTMKAIKESIEKLGGEVVGQGAVMNIVELNNNKEVFSLIDVNEE